VTDLDRRMTSGERFHFRFGYVLGLLVGAGLFALFQWMWSW
jgi:hypothetical protein